MASLGHEVVGIDLTESMIEKAGEIADMLDYNIDFKVLATKNTLSKIMTGCFNLQSIFLFQF